jgi:hypothetical protein
MKFITTFMLFLLIEGTASPQTPLNWTRDEINPGEDFTLSPDESYFTEGFKSCHFQLNSSAVPYLVSDVYYVTPGAAYEFSFDVFDNDTAGQVKIYADFYDTYGFDIFGMPPVFSSDSSEWQTISWQGVIPSQAVVGFILIKFYNQPDLYNFTKTAHIWIDNFSFRQDGGDNLASNGGFEEWVVGINEIVNNGRSVSIYPNPANYFVNIDLPANAIVITISDLTGREVLKQKTDGRKQPQVDVSQLHEGMYITSVILGDGSILTGKLLKQ